MMKMMRTKALSIFVGLILAGCSAESAPAQWQQSEFSNAGLYQAQLDCENPPETGSFQNCWVSFSYASGQAMIPQAVHIDGGMPLHGHGLPTSPVLTSVNKPGTYRIDGLKYNMPGAWLLGFRINAEQGEDKVIFDFVI